MKIIDINKDSLLEIKLLLSTLSDEDYVRSLDILSNASIGQHVRHILEFYTSMFKQLAFGVVCYDDRARDFRIESDRLFAQSVVDSIFDKLELIREDKPLVLKANYSKEEGNALLFESSLFRELAYNLEHAIHHQAIIKIGITELEMEYSLGDEFGLAPSTIRFQKN